MSAIDTLLARPATEAIGWALLHFIWQGALVGLVAAAALAALRKSAADVRYVVAAIAMSLMVTMPVVTAVQSWRSASAPRTMETVGAGAPVDVPIDRAARTSAAPAPARSRPVAGPPATSLGTTRLQLWLPAFVLAWCCGVALLTLRLLSGWVWVRRLTTRGIRPASASVATMVGRLSKRLHIRRTITLLESAIVDVPTVIGWLKPVVLLPASALAGLTPEQLEAILAHELAHIRRHDYAVNLLQTLVETLLFYHPAVWWLSRRIRAERENCCDDLAVSLCGDPYTYARALADLEELRGARGRLVLAASGGSLLQRVRRLLGAPTHAGHGPGWLAGTVAILLMFGLAAGAAGTDAFQAVPARAAVPAPAAASADVPPAAVQAPEVRATTLVTRTAPRAEDAGTRASTPAAAPALAAPAAEALLAMSSGPATTRAAVAAAPPAAAGTPAAPPAQGHGNFVWSHNGEKIEANYDGTIEFTDDDTDVKTLSPNGSLKIKDGGWLGGRTVEFTADSSGRISRRYWVGMSEKPFEPEGRQWLAQALPRFIRQTGIGAPARVARILRAKGPAGVLAEISLIEGSWAKRIYFTELFSTGHLDQPTLRQALAQAGREIDSDYELATLLIKSGQTLTADEATRKAYFEAARGIKSDYELHRVLGSALTAATQSPATLVSLLETSHSIDSDYEEASLLVQVAKAQPLDKTTRPAFFAALATVGGDYEHGRVLSALAAQGETGSESAVAMLESATALSSDFESASFLLKIVKQQPVEGAIRAPFFRAVDRLHSSYERGRVLLALVHRGDNSTETTLAVLKAVRGMSGSYEVSQVLLAVAASTSLTGEARSAYIDAADKLGDYEQGRTLAALVKSERRK
jgi:beta-lactamase regulating signal transducer with metallopeptidase domain